MALPGNYASVPTGTLTAVGGFSVSGQSGILENTYTVTLSKGDVTLTAKYGPQGFLYDSDLVFAHEVTATLGGVGISLGSVQIGSEAVSVTIGGLDFSYTRSNLDAQLAIDIEDRFPDQDTAAAAQIAADVIKVAMDAFGLAEKTITTVSPNFPQPADFSARFIDADSGSYVDTPENIVETNGFNTSFTADGATRIAASGEDYVFVHVGEETDADVIYIFYRTDTEIGGSASGIQSAYNEFGGSFFSFGSFLVEMFGYEPIGNQYVFNFNAAQIVQTGFDESFNFGPGTIDDGIGECPKLCVWGLAHAVKTGHLLNRSGYRIANWLRAATITGR